MNRIHGICVCDTAEYFYATCNEYLEELGLMKTSNGGKMIKATDIVDLIDDYKETSSLQEELG